MQMLLNRQSDLIVKSASAKSEKQKPNRRVFQIDFSKNYDLTCAMDSLRPVTYRNCLVLGFTKGASYSKKGDSEVGSGYFDEWLVVKMPDGRRLYIETDNIDALEETRRTK
jgi:hypothetical protein